MSGGSRGWSQHQAGGNDGKSYALSCIACAQNCNKTFKWKDGVCGILGQKTSPTELFGEHLEKPKHSGQSGREEGLEKPGNTFKPGHRDESYSVRQNQPLKMGVTLQLEIIYDPANENYVLLHAQLSLASSIWLHPTLIFNGLFCLTLYQPPNRRHFVS
ncbi:hypothetical protein RvY_08167 [Ramazzottius varieornatus]|uniref:Uncharacterized protein n=1 Tax=Ramazzottius varieornatus TaxID=947166 RepID=A0A1D1V4V2_RAMVA|nr:hypothetical protein RvY_08167 [Ramazzottius varieornatus]